MKISAGLTVLAALVLAGCTSLTRVDHVPANNGAPQRLAIFLDGTANDESSHTNVSKLYNLVTLRKNTDIATTYIKGVGTDGKLAGAGLGWGLGRDVREAYLFLVDHFDHARGGVPADKVYVFGFSRGSYTVRVLAALLYIAGVPEVSGLSEKQKRQLVADVYATFKDGLYLKRTPRSIERKREDIVAMLAKKWPLVKEGGKPVGIEFLGLWETVEALGWPDYKENINEPNQRYSDQLCNLRYVAHALAIDDNRARVFTPLLMTRKHLAEEVCDEVVAFGDGDQAEDKMARVKEVWFAGAHSDVGGGYKDTEIDGVSLNWMIAEMHSRGAKLLPRGTEVYADFLGKTHNPEGGGWGLIYAERNRNLACYIAREGEGNAKGCVTDGYDGKYIDKSSSRSGPLKVHQSVLDRLCWKTPEKHESFWFQQPPFVGCVQCLDGHGSVAVGGECKSVLAVANADDQYEQRPVESAEQACKFHGYMAGDEGGDYRSERGCVFVNGKIRAEERLDRTVLSDDSKSADVTFYPDIQYDRSGIYLRKGRQYKFTITEYEHWADADNTEVNPFGGRKTWTRSSDFTLVEHKPVDLFVSNLFNIVGKLIAHAPLSGYMELIGYVVADSQVVRDAPGFVSRRQHKSGWPNRQTKQLVKVGQLAAAALETGSAAPGYFTPEIDGELVLLVNEPRWLPMTYENNFGKLTLAVELIPDDSE